MTRERPLRAFGSIDLGRPSARLTSTQVKDLAAAAPVVTNQPNYVRSYGFTLTAWINDIGDTAIDRGNDGGKAQCVFTIALKIILLEIGVNV